MTMMPPKDQQYTIAICEKTLNVTENAYWQFKNRHSYTIYYAPRTGVILSAEPMEVA